MEPNEKRFIHRLKNIELTPEADSFDSIFENYNKPRKKYRGFLGIAIFALTVCFSGVVIYFTSEIPQSKITISGLSLKNTSTKEHSTTQTNNSINQQEIHTPIIKNKVTEKPSSDAEQINIEATQINQLNKLSQSSSVINKKKSNTEKLNSNLPKSNLFTGSNPLNKVHKINRAINNIETKPLTNQNSNTVPEKYQTATIALLQSSLNPLKNTEIYKLKSTLISPIPIRQKMDKRDFQIGIAREFGQQKFCSFAEATQNRWGVQLSKNLTKNVSFIAGYSKSTIDYSFPYTPELNSRFGNTDKYPVLALLSNQTQSLSTTLNYSSIDIGLNIKLLKLKHHAFGLLIGQEFVVGQHQSFTYSLDEQKSYTYVKTTKSVQAHQVKPALTYQYQILSKLHLSAKLSYNYSLDFIGLEKEKYSGYNLGLGLNYDLK